MFRETDLTFRQVQQAHNDRDHSLKQCIDDWTLGDWGNAMAGECGEACNIIKKMRRGQDIPVKKLADELADVVAYAALIASQVGIDLGEAVRSKFNEVSARPEINSEIRL